MIAKKRCGRPDREKDVQMNGIMDGWTYKINWTSLVSFVPQCEDKCIVKLDTQTGKVFVFISSVGVQRCDIFIWLQKGLRTTRQTDKKTHKARGQPYR